MSHQVDVPPVAQRLLDRVRCPVHVPGEDSYEKERTGHQTAITHAPEAIVAANSADDVAAAVLVAAGDGLPLAVQGSGHQVPVPLDGGVLVTTGRMSEVTVDAERRTAWLGGGATWRQVIDAAVPHGLAPLNGSAPGIAAVPYVLGGGTGLLARAYGFAADHVRSLQVVTADGEIRTVSESSEPDLFWALRGGGAGFGVVTGAEVALVPLPTLYGGGLYFAAEHAGRVLAAYEEWTRSVPEELTSSIAMFDFPDVPAFPDELRGRYAAHIRIAYAGSAAEGEELLAPLRAVAPRLLDTVAEMPYADCGGIYSEPPFPHAYLGNNALVKGVPSDALARIPEIAGPGTGIMCIAELRHLGGACARPPRVGDAISHRDAEYVLRAISPVTDETAEKVREVHERLFAEFRPWTVGRSLNFILGDGATPQQQVRECFDADTYRRLVEVKRRYDVGNLFRYSHSVAGSEE